MNTPTILQEIKAYKLDEIAAAKRAVPLAEIEARAAAAPPVRSFFPALLAASKTGFGLIAEIKKASPSKGLIRADFDPPALARAYEEGGATCLSVLTDGPSFQGDPAYLGAAREACNDTQAAELEDAARHWGMDALLEVHNEEELARAERLGSPLIGINNRDLNTFQTSLDTTRRLSRLVSPDRLIVCESGLGSAEDLAEMARYGARCFLIGEALMRQADVAASTRAMLNVPQMSERWP